MIDAPQPTNRKLRRTAAEQADCPTATSVGAHIVRPGNPAAAQTPRATTTPTPEQAPLSKGAGRGASRGLGDCPATAATSVGTHIVRPGNPAPEQAPLSKGAGRGASRGLGDCPATATTPTAPAGGQRPGGNPSDLAALGHLPLTREAGTPTATPVGAHIVRPGTPAAPQTPAGGINPAPTAPGDRPATPANTPRGARNANGPLLLDLDDDDLDELDLDAALDDAPHKPTARPNRSATNPATASVGAHIVRPGNPAPKQAPLSKGAGRGASRGLGDCPATAATPEQADYPAATSVGADSISARPAAAQGPRATATPTAPAGGQRPGDNPSGLAALGHLPLTREAKPPQTLRPTAKICLLSGT